MLLLVKFFLSYSELFTQFPEVPCSIMGRPQVVNCYPNLRLNQARSSAPFSCGTSWRRTPLSGRRVR